MLFERLVNKRHVIQAHFVHDVCPGMNRSVGASLVPDAFRVAPIGNPRLSFDGAHEGHESLVLPKWSVGDGNHVHGAVKLQVESAVGA